MVVAGILLIVLAFAPWIFVVIGVFASPIFGPSAIAVGGVAAALTCCLSPALLIIGIVLLIMGLFTSEPVQQIVYVQAPPPQPPRP